MSKDKIKIGRYSTQRTELNKLCHAQAQYHKLIVPFLPQHSDAQDITIRCSQSFSEFFIRDLNDEIENFDLLNQMAEKSLKEASFDRQEFFDIYDVTGIELDNRLTHAQFSEDIAVVSLKHFFRSIKCLPGMNEIPMADFYRIVLSNYGDYYLLLSVISGNHWQDDTLIMNIDSKHSMIMDYTDFIKLCDFQGLKIQQEHDNRITETHLTYEEATFLVAIHMLNSAQKFPQLETLRSRVMLAFIRYLECRYDKNQHLRFSELINLDSFLKEKRYYMKKWLRKHKPHINKRESNKVFKAFFTMENIDEAAALLQDLKL
ncbi:unnamed protein product [Dimorphilus gyrociliatus]|uniref:Uncharacterized protein n=1 Tax=Dimorphilus gyrociliatus TaxID=2664684 RepID=A0A7I8VRQ3_9ANNE|nr:unnamed protein product [Dimorphilus gyrociliatus]